jgi:hypothetical protein
MRPLALCLYYPGLAAWLNLPAGPVGPSGNITVPFTNSYQGCPGSGNWGWLDYDNSGGGASTLASYVANGYPKTVTIPSTVQAKTGSDSSLSSSLNALIGKTFPIAMYDSTNTDSHGNNTQFHVVAAAMVKLVSFQLTGNNRNFVFQFLRGTLDGTCCGTGPSTGALVTALCAFNTDPKTGQCGL